MRQRGFLAGIQLYAFLGVLVVIAGLGLSTYALYYKAKAAEERVKSVEAQRDSAIAAVKRSEEANQKLMELSDELNKTIVLRDKRAHELETAKRNLGKELDELRKSLPAADQECLVRDLPGALADRLRDS